MENKDKLFVEFDDGTLIPVSRSVMTSVADTAMESMFSGRWDDEIQDNKVKVQGKDPLTFMLIIKYLEDDMKSIPDTQKMMENFESELQYWCLPFPQDVYGMRIEKLLNKLPVNIPV